MQNNPEPCPPRTLNLIRQHERRETFQQRGDSNLTLEPGDVISTGTPGGVAGVMKPPKWLVPGDEIRVEIEGLDSIETTVIEEPAETTLI